MCASSLRRYRRRANMIWRDCSSVWSTRWTHRCKARGAGHDRSDLLRILKYGDAARGDSQVISVAERPRLDHSRSEEHTSELQSHSDLVCRLLLEKKKQNTPGRQVVMT